MSGRYVHASTQAMEGRDSPAVHGLMLSILHASHCMPQPSCAPLDADATTAEQARLLPCYPLIVVAPLLLCAPARSRSVPGVDSSASGARAQMRGIPAWQSRARLRRGSKCSARGGGGGAAAGDQRAARESAGNAAGGTEQSSGAQLG